MTISKSQIEYLLHLTDQKIAELEAERTKAIAEIDDEIEKIAAKASKKTLILRKKDKIIARQKKVFSHALSRLNETKENLQNSLAIYSC